MLFGVGVLDSLFFTFLIKALADQLPTFGERASISAVIYVVIMLFFSAQRSCLFLLVYGKFSFILL